MKNLELTLQNLIGKNETQAQEAANYLINTADKTLFKMLVDKSDFLFEFVRNNINKRIQKATNKNNFMNILNFFDIYSPCYDDLFASILSFHANQDLTDEIYEFLEKGSTAQKTYAAKYFSYIPDTIALEILNKYAFYEDEHLSFNSAEALGQMQDDISYNIALGYLNSEDEFEKLKAVKFFTAYGKNFPLKDIFKTMQNSKMPENIAGQIPYMESLLSLLKSDYKLETLYTIDNIINGLGEILCLSDIFQFELYEVLEYLIKTNKTPNEYQSKIAQVLLSALVKFNIFNENQEYTFDEDKNTKEEIISIFKLLQNEKEEFWNLQKELVISELKISYNRILAALPIIKEYTLINAIPILKNLINDQNETLVCEVVATLKTLNAISKEEIKLISSNIKNPNIKAIIEN